MMVWVRELTSCVGVVVERRCCNLYTMRFGAEQCLHVVVKVWGCVEELWPLEFMVVK